jgi:nucleotide-binding universal stress UspA family protein
MSTRRILVAYDGSEAAFHAVQEAVRAAEVDRCQIDVVTVLPREIDAVREATEYLRDRGFEPVVHTPVGDPASEIARVAAEGGYEVVYLGTRGRGSLERALEGSVSSKVAEDTELTVVIAR